MSSYVGTAVKGFDGKWRVPSNSDYPESLWGKLVHQEHFEYEVFEKQPTKLPAFKNTYIRKVEEFMTTFQQPVVDKPNIMLEDRNKLRIALIFEELKEYAEASGLLHYFNNTLCEKSVSEFNSFNKPLHKEQLNLTEQFDALLDLQYVLSGAVIENGFKDIFDKGFDEVHRSNMSKACNTKEEGLDTCVKYQKEGTQCTTYQIENKFVVKRDEDNKVLKSINYSPANLLPIIEDGQRNN